MSYPSVAEERINRAAYIDGLKTSNGGWKRDDLKTIGVPWPPTKGWRKRYIVYGIDLVREVMLWQKERMPSLDSAPKQCNNKNNSGN